MELVRLDSGLYRASLDGRAGLLLFEANPLQMTLAFDTALGGVVLAWKGPAAKAAKGMAALKGILYHRQAAAALWRVAHGSDTVDVPVRFEGYAVSPGSLEVRFDLLLPGGDSIAVKEYLNHDDHYGDHALESELHFTGILEGRAAILRVAGDEDAGRWPPIWATSVGRLEGGAGAESYVQEFDGVGQVKATFTGSASL